MDSANKGCNEFLESECPVCFEELFDANGRCPHPDGVAATVCHHVVHTKCLTASCALEDSDQGFGIFGERRVCCAVCSRALTIWTSSRDAAYHPGFWIPLVLDCLQKLMPTTTNIAAWSGWNEDDVHNERAAATRKTISAEEIREELRKHPALREDQKKYINASSEYSNAGLQRALVWAGRSPRVSNLGHLSLLPQLASSPSTTASSSSSSITSTMLPLPSLWLPPPQHIIASNSGNNRRSSQSGEMEQRGGISIVLPGMSTRGHWDYNAEKDEITMF